MNTYFDIFFQCKDQQQRLRYRVVDSLVSQLWQQHVKKHIEAGYTIPPDVQWFYANVSREKLESCWQSLQQLCQDINNEHLLEKTLELNSMENYQDLKFELNRLHFEFHNTKENKNKPSRALLLQMFNIEIHRAENLLGNLGQTHSDLRGCFYLENLDIPNIDIRNHFDLLSYWDHSESNGDLMLGYHTIGKSLYHCWLNNDIDLVKKQMIRPQDNISTEVMLFFTNETPLWSSQHRQQQLTHWVNENKLYDCIDWSDPRNMIVGYPKLAENIDNLTYNDVNEIFETGYVYKVALEKE